MDRSIHSSAVYSRMQRRRNAPVTVDVAPLMDMVFILLIFFLVTSTFREETGIDISRPEAEGSVDLLVESLRVSIAPSGAVYVAGKPVTLAQLDDRVRRHVADPTLGAVVIIPDESVSAGRLIEVMDVAKLAGARDLAVATRPRGEP